MCVALDAHTGAELWASPVGVAAYDSGVGDDDGPRSTPSVEDGRVYVLSSYLVLHCFNATNGTPVWSKDLRALYGGTGIGWQNAASPLVDNGLVYVNGNTSTQSLFAFRTLDGSLAWRSQNAPLTHSTPVATAILGEPQIVFAAQNGLVSLNRTNGLLLWRSAYPFNYDTSLATSPVVYSNIVFISANYSMGSFATRITLSGSTFAATPAWTNSAYKAHWMTPVCHQGYLYGMFGSSATSPLKCIDIQTGLQRWSVNGFGRGGTILVDNQVLALSEKGDLVLIEPNPAAYTETARFTAFPNYDSYTNKCWNVAAVCDGRIFARSTAEAICLDLAVPALRLLPPEILGGNRAQIQIGTESGAPINPARFANMEILYTTNLALGITQWMKVTSALTLADGMVSCEVGTPGGTAFYVVTEPR